MLFNSYIFVLLFLPIVIIGYFSLNHFGHYKLATLFLLGMSLWFYAYFNLNYLPIIIISLVINFTFYKLFEKDFPPWFRKTLLIVASILNIGVLFYFKYYDFFFENINAVFKTSFAMKHLILPLGISFFTFQQFSFVIDSYKRETPKYSFIDYALFVTYFPQLIAGPIVTHDELIPQLMDQNKRKLNWDNVAKGLYMFALGMGKKVLIADTFGNAANWGFSNIDSMNTIDALIVMLSYTIQIYFDFSGYCDMAIGIGKMMNIDLPLNFNSPYKSLTIVEFWKRWHMTLTRFFTKYIYIPLGGSRKGAIRTHTNIMIVFLVSGLWHGANWTFILWGALHGVFNVITRALKKYFDNFHPALNWLITFIFINVTWLFFRADSIPDAVQIIKNIIYMDFGAPNANLTEVFTLPEISTFFYYIFGFDILTKHAYVYMVLFFATAFLLLLGFRNAKEHMDTFRPTLIRGTYAAFILIWSIFTMSSLSTFLYFNF